MPDLLSFQQKAAMAKGQMKQFLESKPQQYEQAKKMMSAAVDIVIGEKELPLNDKQKAAKLLGTGTKTAHSEDGQTYFIYALATDETPKYKGKFDAGLKLSEATNWVKDYVTSPKENVAWRKSIIEYAFRQVYGREPNAAELVLYNQLVIDQKAWFTKIVSDENGKLDKDAAAQKATISRAYQKAMGRDASEGEIAYWQPRKNNYSGILESARSYLYSEAGAKDLRETVTRYRTKAGKSQLTEDELNKAIQYYKPNKLIYAEMY